MSIFYYLIIRRFFGAGEGIRKLHWIQNIYNTQ